MPRDSLNIYIPRPLGCLYPHLWPSTLDASLLPYFLFFSISTSPFRGTSSFASLLNLAAISWLSLLSSSFLNIRHTLPPSIHLYKQSLLSFRLFFAMPYEGVRYPWGHRKWLICEKYLWSVTSDRIKIGLSWSNSFKCKQLRVSNSNSFVAKLFQS